MPDWKQIREAAVIMASLIRMQTSPLAADRSGWYLNVIPRSSIRALSFASMLLFGVLFSLGESKPVHLDDTDFLVVAQTTAVTYKPIYYRGVENSHSSGLYHPPLYIYLLAGWLKVFGSGEAQARLFGFVCALLQGWIVTRIIYTIFGTGVLKQVMPWLWILFLLNPYTIQAASVLDIDSTIYGPLLCLVLLGVLRLCWRAGAWRTDSAAPVEYLFPTIALTLAFGAKLTTVWLVPPFCVLLLIPRLGWAKAIRAGSVITVAAFGCFAAIYFAYGRILHLETSYTYSFTLFSLLHRGSSGGHGLAARLADYVRNGKAMLPYMVRWAGGLPWIGIVAALVYWGVRARRRNERKAYHYFCLLLLAGATTVYYCCQQQAFGAAPFKYTFCYWALLLSALPMIFQALWSESEASETVASKWRATILGAALIAITLTGFVWGKIGVRDRLNLSAEALQSASCRAAILLPVLLLSAALLWRGLRGTRNLVPGAILYSAALCLYAGLELGISVAQEQEPYSTTYNYGQTGLEDTVLFIRDNTEPTDIIASMKDVGYHANRPYFENYAAVYGDEPEMQRLEEGIASGKMKLAVFTEDRGEDQLAVNPKLKSWIEEHCIRIVAFGNYRIYKLRAPAESR